MIGVLLAMIWPATDLPADDATVVPLSARERAMLEGLGSKLEQWLENPATPGAGGLGRLLAPIAQRLGELLGRVQES